ncbi:aspartate--tRNA ligase [Paenibacillus thiaminolyticus]|uniref:Aspartate--tRNA ligase n=1 Tax=Paenibacillus thiaminolyticus TaxID=49283 RepID=A0AAP9DXL9_PANTH|nr:aspartate--tRNA ligase [Paenibacillus thiaminolyticus]MCY9534135.1 aspartate--tRNA ligase [Paenibacillus thiaminolyticus]MCY9604654.1 aspartate--tRNA ligase [Paenibacillus thiaminolyticus]MCY9610187.1 aspartate--tRNA ligase [Paenibacillus thiaminolyticus]MCY9614696.1 aspartate--tRNA ligase [Paenibacillus thiaminolyticus]MCY9621881.1 aspartate--tRNA ligase [Paenibacillus thiaminolyticus]
MMYKTHSCGDITKARIGETVTLNGWVQRRRDLGGVLFVDLRDRTGLVQIVFNTEFSTRAHEIADRLRNEFVVAVSGQVVMRDAETVNPNLPTGDVEVRVTDIEILNGAKNPPFFIEDGIEIDESLRLRYRYLDLRRPEMQRTLKLRSTASKVIRDFLDDQEFVEVETPILTKSTPEGARDYLVPSRVHPGEFFALPQSPQLFKQLLMVSGLERYYQIARCFRDEDLRADRQPEFTQVDIETSFLSEEQLQGMMEQLMVRLFKTTIGVDIPTPFQRITYQEAMEKYGSDKPDLRFGLELVDVCDLVANSGVKVFGSVIEKGGVVKVLNAKGCGTWSRKDIDDLGPYAARYGAKGLAWIQVKDGEFRGPIVKFMNEEEIAALRERTGAEDGDLLLFSADTRKVVYDVLGNLRLYIGRRLNLIDESVFKFAWVVDFPLLDYDEDEKRYVAAHHPFTRPKDEDLHLFDSDPGQIRAQAYDLVLNGYEVGGGSLRIYKRDVQEKMFSALGFSPEEAQEKFGFLLNAFEYGTPPHGGIALGLDRLIMLLAGRTNLRETIAFPKTASAVDLMMDAPNIVEPAQLEQLHIKSAVKKKDKKEEQ